MSSFTHSIHVILGLPLLTPPTTSKFLHLETQSSASLRSTCPNHLSLPRLTTSSTPSIPSPHLSFSLRHVQFRRTVVLYAPDLRVRRQRFRYWEFRSQFLPKYSRRR